MPVITKTMPPITRHRYRSQKCRLCLLPAGCHKRSLFTELSWSCCPTDGSGKNRTITLHLTSTGAATPGHRKSSPLPAASDKLNATEDSGYPATYYAVVGLCAQSPVPCQQHRLVSCLHRSDVECLSKPRFCLKARQWYQA